MKLRIILLISSCLFITPGFAQSPDEEQLGAWYMYFVQKKFKDSPWGIQGDYQFRFWDAGSDLEQILLRTGLTYTPKNTNIMFTAGYANITTGQPGENTRDNVVEHRIYQEALIPQKIGSRVFLTHRFRYEQRWVDDQDFRTRYRYNIFMNVALNKTKLEKGTLYLAFYNEIFVNGEREIGDGRSVEYFDRNRTYGGLGFGLRDNLRFQLGVMRQTTDNWAKNQAQVSLHHNF